MSARDLPLAATDLPLSELLAQAAGSSTRIDPQARVEGGAVVGEGCDIRSGVVVARGTVLGRGVRVAANAVFVEPEDGEVGSVVGDGVRIGANAVVHAGLRLGAGATVRPGAVVECSVAPGAIVAGNPAVVVGHAAAGVVPLLLNS